MRENGVSGKKYFARFWSGLQRRWRWLLILIFAAASAAGAPHLWAWYHFRAGRSALERYHAEEAHTHLNACLKVWPQSGQTQLLAARAARRVGLFNEAAEHLEKCQRLLGSSSPDRLLEQTLLQAASGNIDHHLEEYLFSRLRNDVAQRPLIVEALTEGYLRKSRPPAAYFCLVPWLESQPDNVQALFLRARCWRGMHQPAKAAADFHRVMELDPQRHDARREAALCLMETGQYGEAAEHLEEIDRWQPGDPEVLVRLASCQIELGQKLPAQEILDRVLQEHPDHGLALRQRGRLALREGQADKAENWLRQAVRILPNDYPANVSLAESLQQQGKIAEAQTQQERARKLRKRLDRLRELEDQMSSRPHDPSLLCELGTLLISLGCVDAGLTWLQSTLDEDPYYRPAHAALVEYYEKQGDTTRAAYHRQLAQGTSRQGQVDSSPRLNASDASLQSAPP